MSVARFVPTYAGFSVSSGNNQAPSGAFSFARSRPMATSYPDGRLVSGIPVLMLEICRHCASDLVRARDDLPYPLSAVLCPTCDAPEEPDTP